MKRIVLSLLVALLVAPAVSAQSPGAASALLSAAGRSSAQWAERLKAGHKRLDAALATRTRENATYQTALAARNREAAGIEAMKKSGIDDATLKLALAQALTFDEKAAVAQSELLAAEAAVARRGAELLGVYDALILDKRNEAGQAQKGSAVRQRAVDASRALATRRAQIRKALLPVIKSPRGGADNAMLAVRSRDGDDIETLLEKADLARDLERRFWRRAEAVRKRIHEIEQEDAIARDVIGMVQRNQLFDESDRRLFVSGNANASRASGGSNALLALSGGAADAQGANPADPSPPPQSDDNGFQNEAGAPLDSDTDGVADEPNSFSGAEEVANRQDPGGGTSGESPTAATGGSAVTAVAAERALMGMLNANAGSLDEVLAQGELSIDDLKALEKKLRKRARVMRSENQKIRGRISSQAQH